MKTIIKTISVLFFLVFSITACSLFSGGISTEDLKNTVVAQVEMDISQKFPASVPALPAAVPIAAPTAAPIVIVLVAPTNAPAPASPAYTPIPAWPTPNPYYPYYPYLSTPAVRPCNWPVFVSETVPDGTAVPAGTPFDKTWTLVNSGNCNWNTNYRLVFYSGNPMGGTYINFPSNVGYGNTITLTLHLIAPTIPGSYTGYWKLQTDSGYYFGQLWVTITVY
jgi:hypothetical protein